MLTGRFAVPVPRWCSSTRTWPATDRGHVVERQPSPLDLEADRRIDYVLVGCARSEAPVTSWTRAARIEPVNGVHPSDHYAVVAELRY
jgi:endonuclease/exonuclease/phosphatase family metal-dependent hydrolase